MIFCLFVCVKSKEGKGLDTCYSVAYEKTREQQHFTILEVAADWHVQDSWKFHSRILVNIGILI